MGSNALDDRRAGIDVVLTNLSIGIPTDQGYINRALLPTVRVPTSKVKVPVWGTEAFRIREDRVADYSEPDKLDISLSTVLIEVDGHSLMAPVSDRHQVESERGPLKIDLANEALQTIVASMELSREKLAADLITNQAAYTASPANKIDLNGAEWSVTTNDPLSDIIPMLESTVPNASGRRPNTFWMGQPVWAALIQNPFITNRLFGTYGPQPIPTTAQLANLLGVDRVLVGRAMAISEAGAVTQLWGDNAGLVYVAPTAGSRVPSFGYTIEETVFGSASEKVVRFRDEKMGASGGEWIKRSSFYTQMIVGNTSGSLFYNAVV